jgi:hypothetical protein
MDISYSVGPRILSDGTNLDEDVLASFPVEVEVDASEPVTGLFGVGYEPGQKNKDNSDL